MDRYPRSNGSIVERANSGIQAYMAQVYGWMTCGLLLTAFVSWYAANTPAILNFIFSSQITFFGLIIAQLALVFVISGMVNRLSGFGSMLFMALIGIVLASLVNIWLKSTALMWAITYIGVVVFVGLTAYDTQKLKAMGEQLNADDKDGFRKYAIVGALTLYLDFINLFLMLLRIFGNRR
ncbi:Bax inhibitor-1 family protein [Serratia marcescens]|uniref:Bax inhibitor-1/YccA family protein n=1 Tax=Serratia marcescens TaxID=615 RepID=UPI0039ECFA66